MDWPFALINGALCVAAIVFAAHVPHERRAAVTLACMMTLGWAFYISAWTAASPAKALAAVDIPIDSKDLWSVMDALIGIAAVALAWMTWWGWAFWLTALTSTAVHLSYRFGAADFEAYSHVLDKILLAQIALFIFIGGRGVSDRIVSWRSRRGGIRRLVRGSATTTARTAP